MLPRHDHTAALKLLVTAFLLAATIVCSRAQFTFANDRADNYSSATWTNASDLGSGFGGWGFSDQSTSANMGSFIGNPTNSGINPSALGSAAFGLYSVNATAGYANRSRGFDVGMGVGDVFTFDWGMNWDAGNNSGAKGFDIRSGSTNLFTLVQSGTNAAVNFNNNINSTTGAAANSYGTNNMAVTLTRTASGYTFTMTSRNTGGLFTTNISTSATIDNFNLFTGNQNNADNQRNIFFDNFSITNSGVFSQGGSVTNANTFAGTGALSVGNNTTLALSGSGNNNYSGATTISNGSTLRFQGSGTSDFGSAISGGGTIVISNGSGQVNLQANNSSFTGNVTVANGSVEAQSANALGPGSGTTTVQSGGTLRLWNASGLTYAAEALTLNGVGVGSGGALRNITNNNTWQGAITLGSASRINSDAGTLTLDVASGNAVSGTFDLTIGGNGNVAINDNIGIGTAKLVKDGPGTLTIGAVNNYTGNTEIDAGTLSIGSGGGLSSSSMVFVGSGLNNSDATLLLAGTTTLASAIQVNTTNAAGIGGARFITKSDATSQTLSGNFTNNMQTSVNVANSAGRLTVSGPMAGAGNIVKVGEGTLALSGNSSSFSGGLFIDQGALDLAGGSTGASTIDIGGGAPVNSINASNATLRVSANSTFSTPLTVNANTNALGQSGNRTIDFANSGGTATLSGPLSVEKGFTVNVANSGATGILGGTITGSGGPQITVTGNGILGLTDLNSTTSARWNVQSGSTLAIGNTRNLGTNPANYFVDKVALNGGTLLATNNFSLNANVGIQLGASTASTISVGSGLVMTNPAVMNGSGNLTKSGSGMLVLSGANSNTGTVTVAAGELRVNGNQTAANGALTVNSGATLSGNGTIGGATTISGIHNPGNSPGVQSFNSNLTYAGGSTVNWELIGNTVAGRGTSFDGIDLLGSSNLNFSGATSLNLVFNGAGSGVRWQDAFWGSNRSWLVYDLNGGVVQNFGNFTLLTQNWADSMTDSFNTLRPEAFFSVARTGEDIFLVYTVPEPSTWALLALGAGVLGHRLLKRKK